MIMRKSAALHFFVLVILSGPQFISCNCDHAKTKTSIKSPSYPFDYGKSESCSWNLSPPEKYREYALILTFKRLGLYCLVGNEKKCLGSYNLTIDQDQMDCTRSFGPCYGDCTKQPCKVYYNSPSCSTLHRDRSCETNKKINFPLTIKYESDGKKEEGTRIYKIAGFDIGYKFTKCETEGTTLDQASGTTTASSSITAMTRSLGTTTRPTASSIITTTLPPAIATLPTTTTLAPTTTMTAAVPGSETGTSKDEDNRSKSQTTSTSPATDALNADTSPTMISSAAVTLDITTASPGTTPLPTTTVSATVRSLLTTKTVSTTTALPAMTALSITTTLSTTTTTAANSGQNENITEDDLTVFKTNTVEDPPSMFATGPLIAIIVSLSLVLVLAFATLIYCLRKRSRKVLEARSVDEHELATTSDLQSGATSATGQAASSTRNINPHLQTQVLVHSASDNPKKVSARVLSTFAHEVKNNDHLQSPVDVATGTVEESRQLHQASGHLPQDLNQSQNIVYSTVVVSTSRQKETSRYHKSAVENTLYGSTE